MALMACVLSALSDTARRPHEAKLHIANGAETPLADLRLCPAVSETFSYKLHFCRAAQRTKALLLRVRTGWGDEAC